MKTYVANSLEELQAVAAEVLKALPQQPHATILTLSGDLGVGKTAFTQALARELGITEHVTSPTFGIMARYNIVNHKKYDHLVHIDAYRIEDRNETGPLRLEDIFTDSRTLVALEWPERIFDSIPADAITVSLESNEDEVRTIVVG